MTVTTFRCALGLGLICKNEEAVIGNCLRSHLQPGIIHRVCLIDTGSTDNTLSIATAILREYQIPFHIEQHILKPFDFSRARNIYVDYLNDKVDWILSVDCDDVLPQESAETIKTWIATDYDLFSVNYVTGTDTSHVHHRLFRTKLGITFKGAVHEWLSLPPAHRYKHLDIPVLHKPLEKNHYSDSAQRNLEILAAVSQPTPREMFYKAQTLKDLGKYQEAIECYGHYLNSSSTYLDERLHAHWYKAYLERITGNSAAALQTIDEGLALDPSFADLWMEKAWATLKSGGGAAYSYALTAASIPFTKRLFNLKGNYMGGSYSKSLLEQIRGKREVVNLLRPGAMGDVVVSSAATHQLKTEQNFIVYYTKHLDIASMIEGVDAVIDSDLWQYREKGKDFILNFYPVSEGYPDTPPKFHITKYACDICGVETKLPKLKEVKAVKEGNYLTLQKKAGWSQYKEYDHWDAVVEDIQNEFGMPVIELTDNRHISESLSLLAHSKLHLGIDSVFNHAAAAYNIPAIILWGSTSETFSGYTRDNCVNLNMNMECNPCFKEKKELSIHYRGECEKEKCINLIKKEAILEAVRKILDH